MLVWHRARGGSGGALVSEGHNEAALAFGATSAKRLRAPKRPLRLLILLVACAVIAVAAAVALHRNVGSQVRPAGPVISVAGAERVLAQIWPQREMARADNNAATLSRLDTGAELKRDLSVIVESRDQPRGSGRVARPLTLSLVALSSVRQFPASFLAVVQTTPQYVQRSAREARQPVTVLLVVTKTSSKSRWRVAMETSYQGTLEEVGPENEETFHPGRSREPATPAQAAGAVSALASYYQHYADYGGPPVHTPFLPGPWTTEEGQYIALGGSPYAVNSKGFRSRVTYVPAWQDGVYSFSPEGVLEGLRIVCATVGVNAVATPATPGGYLYQPPGRSNWGAELLPGDYEVIRTSGEHQACLILNNNESQIDAISGEIYKDGDLSNVSGVPVPQPQPEAATALEQSA